MSDRIKQSLSALMDDEAAEFELRNTLGQLDSSSAQVWSRYHVARSVLKGEAPSIPKLDISSQVMAKIEQEPAHACGSSPTRNGFQWRTLGSVAVAASVTMMVIFGAQTYQGGVSDVREQPQVALSAPTPVNVNLLPARYGEQAMAAPTLPQADVIRLSSSMGYYIQQHQALVDSRPARWSVGWMPAGFRELEHDNFKDAEVILYSSDNTVVSVSVQPFSARKASPGAVQSGDTVAVGKQVGDQFVTVVGDVPFMIADRIASSVALRTR